MNKMWYDTETSGLDENTYFLLTAFFAVTDKDFNVIDELYLQLKPPEPTKVIFEKKALETNKINLEQHLKDPQTLTYEEGKKKLIEFFERNKIKGKRRSLQPCGHNILGFDNPYIWKHLISKTEWEKYVHYRTLDTTGIVAFLKDIGILPPEVGSLTSLVEYLNIPVKEAHHAKGDVLMNIKVYEALTAMIKDVKKQIATSSNNSLLEIVEA